MIRRIILLLFFWPGFVLAQQYSVTGAIKDSDGQPMPFANVFLLAPQDSTQVRGSSSDESGFFTISEIPPGLYLIKAAYFGYTSRPIALDITKDIRIGAVFLEQNAEALDEVVVIARQPTMERKADRVIYHVENTAVAQGNSWELIRNTPGVINVGGNLEIRGQNASVYINDRKVQLTQTEIRDLLEGLSGTAITSVEVIPNPPARYDAEDGPILNINTNKNIVPGYKGSLQGNYSQAIYPKYSAGTSHYFKTEKFNLFANYNISPRKELKQDDTRIRYIDAGNQEFAIWDTHLDKITRSQAQQANLVLDYEPDDRNQFNLTTNLAYSPNRTFENRVNSNMYNAQMQLDSTLTTFSELENDNTNLSVDLSYEHKLKKEGAILKANVHYTNYDEQQQQEVASDYFNPDGSFIRNFSFYTDSRQDIEIFTGQLDYFMARGSSNFESGVKVSSIQSSSAINYFDVTGTTQTFNASLSDFFDYDETVFAGYMSYLKNWEKWSIKFGVRGEQTDIKGLSLSLNSTSTQNYFELFPSFYVLHTISENYSMSLDYSRKLRRPNYHDLNPFRYFLNENDFNEGNPNLRPNFSHNFNLNFSIKDTYFFDVYYRDNGAFISTLSFQDNQQQTLRQVRQNVLESTSYGLDFTIGKSLANFWYLYGYTSLFSEEETFLALESGNVSATNTVNGLYTFLGNYITLSRDGTLTGECSLTYISAFLDGSYKLSETTNLNLGLRKSLWKNRAVLSLAAEDVLGLANARYTSRYLNQNNSFLAKPETRFFRLGFTYNFGNFRLTETQKSLDKNELERLKTD